MTYLTDAYSDARSDLDAFISTGNPQSLQNCLQRLCNAMEALGSDVPFWTTLAESAAAAAGEPVRQLEELTEFLAVEQDALTAELGDAGQARRLVLEVLNPVTVARGHIDTATVANLQGHAGRFRDLACSHRQAIAVPADNPAQGLGFRARLLRAARVAMPCTLYLAGVAFASANIPLLIANPPIGVGSIGIGLKAMGEAEKALPPD